MFYFVIIRPANHHSHVHLLLALVGVVLSSLGRLLGLLGTDADHTGVGAVLPQGQVGAELLLSVADGAHGHNRLGVPDGHDGAAELGGDLALLLGGLALAQLLLLVDGEEDQLAAVLLQALHVDLALLNRLVATTAIDGDSDGAGKVRGQSSAL